MAAERKEKIAGWGNYPVSESIPLHPRAEEDLRTELKKTPLRVGLSVDVEVETADRSGSFMAKSAPPAGGEVASLDGGPGLDARIHEIIAENAGNAP